MTILGSFMIHVTLKVELLIKLMLESISSNNYFI